MDLEIAGDNKQVAINATTTLSVVSLHRGNPERAVRQLYASIQRVPDAAELRLKLGQILVGPPFQDLEKGAANLLMAIRQMPDYDRAHDLFGIVMAKRGRPRIAYPSLMHALRLNPNNNRARKKLEEIRPLLQGQTPDPHPADIILDTYPSFAPRKLSQVRRDTAGNRVLDGIEVEFHENGRLKRFLDINRGKPNGLEITWDTDGRLLKRAVNTK